VKLGIGSAVWSAMSNSENYFIKIGQALMLVAWIVLAVGCSSGGGGNGNGVPAASAPIPDRPKPENISPDIISTGDRLSIVFADIPNPFVHDEKVRQDGNITLPIVGKTISVAGKTAGQLQEDIHKLFVPNFYKRMTVTVKTDARFFTVSGQVRAPSLLPYVTDMTILRAIAAAGDFTDFADKRSVELTRANGQRFVVDCIKAQRDTKLDLPVYPGDQINIPRRLF